VRFEKDYFRTTHRNMFAFLKGADVDRAIRESFGLPAQTAENSGFMGSISPAGDPAERMLIASRGTRVGLLALADETLAAFDTLIAVAGGADGAAEEALVPLRNRSAANPLLADVLQAFENARPIWKRFRGRFSSLPARLAQDKG
jgi:hypothetical protein